MVELCWCRPVLRRPFAAYLGLRKRRPQRKLHGNGYDAGPVASVRPDIACDLWPELGTACALRTVLGNRAGNASENYGSYNDIFLLGDTTLDSSHCCDVSYELKNTACILTKLKIKSHQSYPPTSGLQFIVLLFSCSLQFKLK